MESKKADDITEGEAAVMMERIQYFLDLEKQGPHRPDKFLVGPDNRMCRLEMQHNRIIREVKPENAFSEELYSIRGAEHFREKPDSNDSDELFDVIVEHNIYNLKRKIKKILSSEEDGIGTKFLEELMKARIPVECGKQAAHYMARMLKRFPQAIDYLPDRVLVVMAETHEQVFNAQAEKMKMRIEKAFETVKMKIIEAAEKEMLPVSVERVNEAMKDVMVNFLDPFSKHCGIKGRIGSYNDEIGSITIDIDLSDQDIERVVMHEAIHALSGKTYMVDRKDHKVTNTRIGLKFVNNDQDQQRCIVRFHWMNEAFTEIITCRILQIKFADPEFKKTYYWEKVLCANMFQNIPNMRTITTAYFEDYDESKKGTGPTMPVWKEVQRFIAEQFGPRFLVNLDDFIMLNNLTGKNVSCGAKIAVKEWKKHEKDFPAFLKEYLTPERRTFLRKVRKGV